MPDNSIKHRDEFEMMAGSGAVRGCSPEVEPGGSLPEHDEAGSGQVELYVVLEGEATISVDGQDLPAPAGTFASLDPGSTRTLMNRSAEPVTALLVGVLPNDAYPPPGWARA